MTEHQKHQLLALLKSKKQALQTMLQSLVEFEKNHHVEVWVTGSVAELGYWLDSDLDVFLDPQTYNQAWLDWITLSETDPKFDMIFSPNEDYKNRILHTGLRPSVVFEQLKHFDNEADLMANFGQRRHDKIIRTLDNSCFFVDQLEQLQQTLAPKEASDFKQGRLDEITVYNLKVENLAFRFVWVGLMILSRYEHLLHPIGAEVKNSLSAQDWQDWVGQLANPITERPAFLMPQVQMITRFYQLIRFDEDCVKNPDDDWFIEREKAVNMLQDWIDLYWTFDRYTRDWLAHHWKPLI